MTETADLSTWVAWTYVFSVTVIVVSAAATWAGLRSERRRPSRERLLVPPESLRALLSGDVDVLVEMTAPEHTKTVEVQDDSGGRRTYEGRYTVLIRCSDAASAPAGRG